MPFPFSSSGKILVESADLPGAIAIVEDTIKRARPGRISVTETRIDFTGGLFRWVTNWNLLGPIGSGSITFRQINNAVELQYHVSFVQMFIVSTALVLFMFGVLPILQSDKGEPIVVLGLMWLWIFGGNYLITIFRFPDALR
jgi:hypothetical protein